VKSWEVLRDATDRVGIKAVAARLKVSSALVYKWCQESTETDPGASGARNPLDRLKLLYEETNDERIINWLCQVANGFFVRNPQAKPADRDEQLLGVTQRVVEDFGELLAEISRSIENDGVISPEEAETIRKSWEHLKAQAEHFVVSCEKGLYGKRGR
jgi:hypothetical protein